MTRSRKLTLLLFSMTVVFACGPIAPKADPQCQTDANAGTLNSPCDAFDAANGCEDGLLCDYGCTDDIGFCGGRCQPEEDGTKFCRHGACDEDGNCAEDDICREDGFCYPAGF